MFVFYCLVITYVYRYICDMIDVEDDYYFCRFSFLIEIILI